MDKLTVLREMTDTTEGIAIARIYPGRWQYVTDNCRKGDWREVGHTYSSRDAALADWSLVAAARGYN